MKPTHPEAIRLVNLAFEAEVLARKLNRENSHSVYFDNATNAIKHATHELLVKAAIAELNQPTTPPTTRDQS